VASFRYNAFFVDIKIVEDEVISWVDVSRHLSGRSNKDSRRRWTKIKDSFNRGVWSRDEDESLRAAVERFGQRWALVTEVVETRSPDRKLMPFPSGTSHLLMVEWRMSETLAQCIRSQDQWYSFMDCRRSEQSYSSQPTAPNVLVGPAPP
jgi:hypothetical protein